jgi:hypothetical protein
MVTETINNFGFKKGKSSLWSSQDGYTKNQNVHAITVLHVHVYDYSACPCPCSSSRSTVFRSIMHVQVMLHVQVHAGCSGPCLYCMCMTRSMSLFHVYSACPCQCLCCTSMSRTITLNYQYFIRLCSASVCGPHILYLSCGKRTQLLQALILMQNEKWEKKAQCSVPIFCSHIKESLKTELFKLKGMVNHDP